MAADKLVPYDPRVKFTNASINGKIYEYMLGAPKGTPRGTVLLLHGFPELGFSYNHQIPMLMDMGLQVVVPNMLGYGTCDPPKDLASYSLKNMADDMMALISPLVAPNEKIIIGSHDWGAQLAWRTALWHPDAIKAIFAMCVPYVPPSSTWLDDDVFFKVIPSFKYWLQLAGPDVEDKIVGKDMIRKFMNGMYLGRGPNGEHIFSAERGVIFENLDKIGKSPILDDAEMDFYVENFARHGLHGPLNWYRTRKINYDDELELVNAGKLKIDVPVLMITASKDTATPPPMAANMGEFVDKLTLHNVDASHWLMIEAADEVNGYISSFLKDLLSESPKARL